MVYSVDHGLRPEAASEARYVVDAAQRLGLAARALRWDGEKPRVGVQAAARAARFRLMGEAMREDGVGVLLTAHHRGDQAETVLMRLAHGSGLGGLRGMDAMAEVEAVSVFRPLLDVPREWLQAVVAGAGLVQAVDPSNVDPHYERVRWRQAMPQLAELGLDEHRLSQFARRADEADTALGQWAAERYAALVTVDPLGAARLPFSAFAALPRAVGVRLLARLLESTGGAQKPRALGTVERLHDRLLAESDFPGLTTLGTTVARRGETVWFFREPGRRASGEAMIGPAQDLLWDHRFRIVNASLAAPLHVRMARELSRRDAERLVGGAVLAPAAAIRSAPLVSAPDGALLALGCYRFSDGVSVELSAVEV